MSSKSRQQSKKSVDDLGLLSELNRSLYLIGHYSKQILEEKKTVFGIPMSVELRRLYSPDRGDHLLERIQRRFNVRLRYPLKVRPPDKYEQVSLDKYINSLAFVSNGVRYTKMEVINLVADQRGAHTDDKANVFHYTSPFFQLPWGNPAKTKLLLPQDLHCLLTISENTYWVAEHQLRVLILKSQATKVEKIKK